EGQGQIYCRFQKDNSLNIKVLSNENYTWQGPLTTKWYHIALVCPGDGNLILYVNGAEVLRENKPAYAGNNLMEKVYFGSASKTWHTQSYCYSEVRLWSCARTQSQIADNMYAVNARSEGLIAYWKCNEGQGTVLHDVTGNGNDIDLTSDVSTELDNASGAWKWMGPVRTDTDKLLDM
ncbi:MAG: LamG-like jellyroll fold domain-containing protein, partial [Candidatus Cryptobacteroides sp.]